MSVEVKLDMSESARTTIQGLLGVRCIFPSSVTPTDDEVTVRCMLENAVAVGIGGKSLLYKDSIEDIVVRLKSLPASEDSDVRVAQLKVLFYI